jgi:hypothetical protein
MNDSKTPTSNKLPPSTSHVYHRPAVKVRLNPDAPESTLSMPLLRNGTLYFARMFESQFIERRTQTVKMEEIEGAVSTLLYSVGTILSEIKTGTSST